MIDSLCRQLGDYIRPLRHGVVAFSGGVDSAVVAKATHDVLGPDHSLAVTAVSPSVPQYEVDIARQVAAEIGIRHQLIPTAETRDPRYTINDGRRCFFCKSELYARLRAIADHVGHDVVILNGTNGDDLGDYRPGLQAAADFQVISPLADLRFTKADVRRVAQFWQLSVWDKPASPCLASRIAYGESVTPEKLAMIEAAENFLRSQGFGEFRVRFHPGKLARIEVLRDEIDRLLQADLRDAVLAEFKAIGFQSVTIDLEGFRSGNLNQALETYQIQGRR